MALLAEEIVEEWLNRQGYFTIRGIKLGVDELDLLAIKFLGNANLECRHFEVQCSMRPVSYISRVPKEILKKESRSATSAKERTEKELQIGVAEWIVRKFTSMKKMELKKKLCPFTWTKELVMNVVRSETEINIMKKNGITVHKLEDILIDLKKNEGVLKYASGASLADLVLMGVSTRISLD